MLIGLVPLSRVGPMLLGTTREEARSALVRQSRNFASLGVQSTRRTRFSRPPSRSFMQEHSRGSTHRAIPEFRVFSGPVGIDVFGLSAEDVVERVAAVPFDSANPELG